ncbi:MAG: hypothetical protein PHO94_00685 [Petrimonas sp.]|nr:hypothetical protein [Petrimonas sp.]
MFSGNNETFPQAGGTLLGRPEMFPHACGEPSGMYERQPHDCGTISGSYNAVCGHAAPLRGNPKASRSIALKKELMLFIVTGNAAAE